MCQSLSLDQSEEKLWRVLGALSSLRNEIAHSFEPEGVPAKMEQLRKVYSSALTPEQGAEMAKQSDEYVAMIASGDCAGFLVTLAEDARKRRKLIDEHWTPRGQSDGSAARLPAAEKK